MRKSEVPEEKLSFIWKNRKLQNFPKSRKTVDPNAEIREVELPEEEVDMDEKKDAEEEKEEKKDKYDEIVFSTRKTRKFEVKINQVFFFLDFEKKIQSYE